MYTQYFNLKQSPFSIAPDPRYLFMSERHREALAHLLYGIGSGGGFVLLTGEIGAGKTTVCRCFMEQIPENCKLGYIFNPKLSVEELLLTICDEFGIELPPQGAGAVSVKGYVDAINAYLLASHAQAKNNVLIIDEAQNLSAEVLEQLRLLTNLETSERKLLQIILIGQPELRTMLARPELEQLAQRVIARYHLGSLSEAETAAYIEHRLAVAGAAAIAPFPRRLAGLIHKLSKGVPRRINLLCDRALLGAYVENQPQVTRTIIRRAASEVFTGPEALAGQGSWQGVAAGARWPLVAAGVAGGVLLTALAWQLTGAGGDTRQAPASAAALASATPAPASALAAVPAAPAPPAAAVVARAAAAQPQAAAASVASSKTAALRQLAGLWGLTLNGDEPCAAAANLNLRCLHTKGGIDELRQLDRPAVLALDGDAAGPRYVLLTALDARSATITAPGSQPEQISLEALSARFEGEFSTYWRAPRNWRDQVSSGDRGADVDWLARRLAQMAEQPAPPDNQALGATLRKRLVEFQAAHQLKADGVAGPKTFIRLYQLGGVQEPRLLAGAGAGK
ncbi:MAG: AAA family ATPase [Duganella sp.]